MYVQALTAKQSTCSARCAGITKPRADTVAHTAHCITLVMRSKGRSHVRFVLRKQVVPPLCLCRELQCFQPASHQLGPALCNENACNTLLLLLWTIKPPCVKSAEQPTHGTCPRPLALPPLHARCLPRRTCQQQSAPEGCWAHPVVQQPSTSTQHRATLRCPSQHVQSTSQPSPPTFTLISLLLSHLWEWHRRRRRRTRRTAPSLAAARTLRPRLTDWPPSGRPHARSPARSRRCSGCSPCRTQRTP